MKRKSSFHSLSARSSSRRVPAAFLGLGLLAAVNSASGQSTYYWNQNGTSAGLGSGGTWGTSVSNVFSTGSADTDAYATSVTTALADTLNIGTSAVGFAGGTILLGTSQAIGSIITGSANTTTSVTINNNTLTFAGSGTITNNSSQELVISSGIAGAGTRLDLNGTGGGITLAAGTNSYTGVTYVNSGTITVNQGNGFGTTAGNTVVASGARINFNNTGIQFADAFNIAGAGVGGSTGALFITAGRANRINGAITLSGNTTIYADSGSSFDLRGGINLGSNALTFHTHSGTSIQTVQTIGISGSGGSLIKTGAGVLNLNFANSYTGNTTISGGTLQMNGSFIEASPIIYIGDGAKLKNTAGNITLQNGRSIVGTGATGFVETNFSATTSVTTLGNNTISNNNSGILTLNRLDVFGSGNQITAGSIVAGSSGTRGLVIGNGSSGTLTITGGSFTSNNGASQADVLGNGAGNGTLIINGGSYATAQTLSLGLNTSASGTLTLTNGIADIGTLAYTASNSGGSGIVNLNGGSLTINTISSTSGATRQFNFNGGQFIASGGTSFANSLTLNVQNGGAKINTNGNSVTILGALVNNGSGGLTKSGAGTLTLSAVNTYTGATTVSTGTLALSDGGLIANSSTISVGSGATLSVTGVTSSTFTVGGAQTVTGPGTILATGKTVVANGTLSPGNSPGTLTQDGGVLQLGANGDLNWQVHNASGAAGTGYDTVNLINGATLDLSLLTTLNPYNINLWSLSGIGPDVNGNAINFNSTQSYTWTLFSTGTAITGFDASEFAINIGAFNGTSGFSNALGGGAFSVDLADSNTDIVLKFTAIPEPRAALLGGLGLLALLRRRR